VRDGGRLHQAVYEAVVCLEAAIALEVPEEATAA
jgi:hypothetical protein